MFRRFHIFSLACIFGLTACVTRRIPEGKYLLDKTGSDFIFVLPDSMKTRIAPGDVKAIVRDSLGDLPKKIPFTLDTLGYLYKEGKYPGTGPFKKKNLTRPGRQAYGHSGEENINVGDIEDILKQKPNRKIFGLIKFHLWLYQLPNPEKVAERAKRKHEKTIVKNEKRRMKDLERNQRRLLKGKEPRELRNLKPFRKTWGEWLMTVVGEEPVLLDSQKTQITVDQIDTYLLKHGYFNSQVRDTIIYHPRKPKATVYYIIEPEDPYRINAIKRESDDEQLLKYIDYAIDEKTIIKPGEILDVDKLEKERSMIATYLANRGYYAFNKDYIYYLIDSTVYKVDSQQVTVQLDSTGDTTYWVKDSVLLKNRVNIRMGVSNIERNVTRDSIVKEPHMIYYIRNVTVITDYDYNTGKNVFSYDTLLYNQILFGYRDRFKVRPYVLKERIFVSPGFKYRAKEIEATYRQLSNLGVYRAINIEFQKVEEDSLINYLDCFIYLTPSKRQSYSVEGNGTNQGGNLGIAGALVYRHKNLFKGAERLSISLKGGVEAQQLITNQDSSVVGGGSDLNPLNSFNTLEVGPVVSLDFPKIIFLDRALFKKWVYTSSGIRTSYNFQRRPDFTRNIQDASIFFEGKPTANHSFRLGLLNLSALKITNQSKEFMDRLADLNDPVLNASFNDHIISSSSFSYTYNSQDPSKRLKNVIYYNGTMEWAGNTLRAFADQFGLDYDTANNSYSLFGIRFAQYVRTSHDFRFYKNHNAKSQSVFRLFGGIGIPGQNLNEALPFERSFFAGGSNGIRAWRARTLGPGHYLDSTFTERFDKIGDIQLEGNYEYRFDFFDPVELAFFVDAGNIWLMNPSRSRPGGDFSTEFWKDIAIGGGIGFRIDLDFFIVRFDLATKFRNPALPEGEKWFYENHPTYDQLREENNLRPYRGGLTLNFGIGYPF